MVPQRRPVDELHHHIVNTELVVVVEIVHLHDIVLAQRRNEYCAKSEAEIAARRAEHERYIDEALSLAQQLFDVEIIIQAAADRSMEAIPHLWR